MKETNENIVNNLHKYAKSQISHPFELSDTKSSISCEGKMSDDVSIHRIFRTEPLNMFSEFNSTHHLLQVSPLMSIDLHEFSGSQPRMRSCLSDHCFS